MMTDRNRPFAAPRDFDMEAALRVARSERSKAFHALVRSIVASVSGLFKERTKQAVYGKTA